MRHVTLLFFVVLLAACRPDPGASDYSSQEDFSALPSDASDADAGPEVLPGPDPWQPGEKRLALGVFYEGGASTTLQIDDVSAHLYIYDETVAMAPDPERVEGIRSHVAIHTGGAWWGFGVHWETARDLSEWETLHLSLKADGGFSEIEVGMHDAPTTTVLATSYGYVADGEWHHLEIPVADFVSAGLDVASVSAPLVITGQGGRAGDELRIDNTYFTAP